jgi:hypothetical protein
LTSLHGLEGVTFTESLHLRGLPDAALTRLSGVEAVEEIGGSLILQDNRVLSDMSALDGLDTLNGCLNVEDNDALPEADAWALYDRVGSNGCGADDSTEPEISGNGR